MPAHDAVVAALERRGELWHPVPGLVALRGSVLALYERLERAIQALAASLSLEHWRVPPALGLHSLGRADYFASFPHWLTVAAHLSERNDLLERMAQSGGAGDALCQALMPPDVALSPAACYHVYEHLAGTTLPDALTVSVQCTCWRHEGATLAPLLRGWAFTMREVVCVGSDEAVTHTIERGLEAASVFAAALGLAATVAPAVDPFFAPTARGRALLQRVKELKRELLVPHGYDGSMAVASFNRHGEFFGDAFGIRTASGQPAASGCVAFGVERWLLAVLCAHGTEPRDWPQVNDVSAATGVPQP